MQFIAIVLTCVVVAVAYGIAHDQVTARVCVEYFTIGHPPIFGPEMNDPTLLALGWGVVATWWVGLLLGVPLAATARLGRRPKHTVRTLLRPLLVLLVVMALCATIAGFAGWIAASNGWVILIGRLARDVPKERHVAFLADMWAHIASYAIGFIGGLMLIVRTWLTRNKLAPKID